MNNLLRRVAAAVLYLHVAVLAAVAAPRHVPSEIYNPPVNSSNPHNFVRVGAKTFFLASGQQIWVTDGTAAGTTMVASGTWSGAAEFKGSLYFVQGSALWRSDGTPAGTVQVTALPFTQANLYSAGSLLYLAGPRQLWVTNGEAGRTLRVRTFSESFTGTSVGHDGKLFFTTMEGTETTQVWSSDGTLWGTRAFTLDNACAGDSACYHGVSIFKLAGKVLLAVKAPGGDYESVRGSLWQTDGTPAGTILVKTGLNQLLASSSSVAYFRAGNVLWKSNGTTAGTVEVAPLPFGIQHTATLAGNTLYLHVTDSWKWDLWTSNGTAAGTTLVRRGDTQPHSVAATATRYFTIVRDSNGERHTLWLSSGAANVSLAAAGTSLFSAGDYVLFAGYEASSGYELWRSDGTAAGTFLLKNAGAETQTGEITGVVRDKAGAPIPGASVEVYGRPYGPSSGLWRDVEVKTGADGTFRVDKLTAGSYYLTASSPQHVRQLYPNYDCALCSFTANGQPVSVLAAFTTVDVDFSLSSGGQFRGVVKGPDGLPATHYADVRIVDSSGGTIATARSRADGTYESAPGLPAGDYYASALPQPGSNLLGVIHGGGVCGAFYPFTCEPHKDGGTPVRATPGTPTTLDFKLLKLPRISGRVVDPATGNPLRGIIINFHDSKGVPVVQIYTDKDGEYSQALPPGSYFVSAVGGDRKYSSQLWHNQPCAPACDVLSGRPVEIAYGTDVSQIDFALISFASRIQLLVTDADSGAPVSTRVTLYRADGSVATWPEHPYDPRTDSAGRYEFTNVPPGKYFLKTGRQLYEGISCTTCAVTSGKPIVIPQGGPVTVELRVAYRKVQRISGRVTIAATGEPVPAVRVLWRALDGYIADADTHTNSDGTWSMDEPEVPAYLVFTRYDFLVEVYNGLPIECEYCEPPAGATVFDPAAINADMTGVNAALKTPGMLSGVARDRAGKPIPYVHITAYDAAGAAIDSTQTNQHGQYSFHFGGLDTDIYLVAESTDYLTQLYNGINCQPCSIPSGTAVAVGPGVDRAGIDFVLDGRPSNEIRGTISDAVTGKPLSSVQVAAWVPSETYSYRTARTDSLGQYKITVPPGSYVVVATPEYDYVRLSRIYGGPSCPATGCDRTTGKVVNVAAGQIVSGIDVQLEKPHITSVSPAFGPVGGGTRVTIAGKYLPAPKSVKFGGLPATILSATSTAIQVETPPGVLGYADVELFISSYPPVTIGRADAFSYVTSASDGDLNGDRRSDVFWRNPSTGANDSWLMDTRGLPVTRAVAMAATTWVFQTLADFNGDGIADVFWRNTSSGQNAVWYMNQNGSTPRSFYAPTQATSWKFVGSGDFDRDGKADLFWQNSSSHQTQVWFGADGGTFRISSSNTVSAAWQAQAIGDLSGDARADVIWRNTSNGQVVVWNMNGATLVSSRPLGTVSSGMRLVGARDMDADGLADLFWRNDTTGENTLWLVNRSSVSIRPLAGVTGYNAVGLGDFNGDGRADVLWRHSTSGLPVTWIMNGATRLSAITLPSRANDWTAYLAK